MSVNIVFLGPPGVGKGTQAHLLAKSLGIHHLATGDLFREEIKNQTELGRKAKNYLDQGVLVSDEVTVAMVRERLQGDQYQKGVILDGFPRNRDQAAALDGILAQRGNALRAVLFVKASPQVIIERLSGRRVCRAAGHNYHLLYSPPRVEGKCDIDGSELYQRDDDRPEVIARRIEVYRESTSPLIEHYRQRGLLVEIDGEQPIPVVQEKILEALAISVNDFPKVQV